MLDMRDEDVGRRELLQRVLASRHFKNSPRLRDFLSYVCERTFANRLDEISEPLIAMHVFGRPSDYNAEDTIVRTAARQLRQKLELYTLGEGAEGEWRLTIPKGSYIPLFERLQAEVPVEAPPPPVQEASPPRRWIVWAAGAVLACGLLVWAGLSLAAMMAPRAIFWRAVLGSGQATQLISGDSGLAMLVDLTHRAVHVHEYAEGKFAPAPADNPASADIDVPATFGRLRYTSMADLVIAAKTAALAEKTGQKLDVKYAREISLSDLKAGNVILVGDPWDNPWVELFANQLNFEFRIDAASHTHLIANHAPLDQEEPVYRAYRGDPNKKAYAMIALTGGLDGHNRALLVEGTTVAGLDAAVDFLFNSDLFLGVLKSAVRGASIDDFEVLLETEYVASRGTKLSIVGSRVHHRS